MSSLWATAHLWWITVIYISQLSWKCFFVLKINISELQECWLKMDIRFGHKHTYVGVVGWGWGAERGSSAHNAWCCIGRPPRGWLRLGKEERTPDPLCLNCMLKWGLSINISTRRNGRMLSHVELMYTHTWHTHMLGHSWVYNVACICMDPGIKRISFTNKSLRGWQVENQRIYCLSFCKSENHLPYSSYDFPSYQQFLFFFSKTTLRSH